MPSPPALLAALTVLVSAPSSSAARSLQEEEADADSEEADTDRGRLRAPLPSPEEIAALPPDGGPEFNRLIFESSPYLLQHVRNPVDWYPWGDEAFDRAKELDRPIFLSIGYSTCHWCHVMEHESFEDEEVAALMNEHFVCIKVDREERPDIDHVYMDVTQAMTSSGGWPMTIVMTPDKKPFFAGTYFPKQSRFGRRGMMELVPLLGQAWEEKREDVLADADRVAEFMRNSSGSSAGEDLGEEALALARRQMAGAFDPEHAGFGQKPKFPVPHNLLFLLQRHERTGDQESLDMVTATLRFMRLGGIYDHVGFGFHRYSTDREWLLPHFEKMLYDQALLTMAYTAAWQITGSAELRTTAEEVLTYVLRDMTSPEGGFYSAEDADSEGEEGLFYVWEKEEVLRVLGAEEGGLWNRVYNVRAEGNFRDEATHRATGKNIPHLDAPLPDVAAELGIELAELTRRLEASREKLFAARELRIHPLKDDKVLTDWNGLMIAAMARAAQAFGEERYAEAATRAADFCLSELRDGDGRLRKRWRNGKAGLPGVLEDYAFLTWGLLDLYETTFQIRHLRAALELTETMQEHFADGKAGGFFLSPDDSDELFVRGKEIYDGAIPSGNSVAALNLLRLGRITGRPELEEDGARTMRAFSAAVSQRPMGHSRLMAAVDFAVGPSFEIVVAGNPEAEDTKAMLRAFHRRFLPHKVLLLRPTTGEAPITEIAPYTKEQTAQGAATAYVCRDFTCKAPTTDVEQALSFLDASNW